MEKNTLCIPARTTPDTPDHELASLPPRERLAAVTATEYQRSAGGVCYASVSSRAYQEEDRLRGVLVLQLLREIVGEVVFPKSVVLGVMPK